MHCLPFRQPLRRHAAALRVVPRTRRLASRWREASTAAPATPRARGRRNDSTTRARPASRCSARTRAPTARSCHTSGPDGRSRAEGLSRLSPGAGQPRGTARRGMRELPHRGALEGARGSITIPQASSCEASTPTSTATHATPPMSRPKSSAPSAPTAIGRAMCMPGKLGRQCDSCHTVDGWRCASALRSRLEHVPADRPARRRAMRAVPSHACVRGHCRRLLQLPQVRGQAPGKPGPAVRRLSLAERLEHLDVRSPARDGIRIERRAREAAVRAVPSRAR